MKHLRTTRRLANLAGIAILIISLYLAFLTAAGIQTLLLTFALNIAAMLAFYAIYLRLVKDEQDKAADNHQISLLNHELAIMTENRNKLTDIVLEQKESILRRHEHQKNTEALVERLQSEISILNSNNLSLAAQLKEKKDEYREVIAVNCQKLEAEVYAKTQAQEAIECYIKKITDLEEVIAKLTELNYELKPYEKEARSLRTNTKWQESIIESLKEELKKMNRKTEYRPGTDDNVWQVLFNRANQERLALIEKATFPAGFYDDLSKARQRAYGRLPWQWITRQQAYDYCEGIMKERAVRNFLKDSWYFIYDRENNRFLKRILRFEPCEIGETD